jgi:hypothetical protein
MKKIIFIFFILFVFTSPIFAGEIYIWKDKKGVENITTTPPPENAKVRDRMQYQRDTPEAIQRYETERKAKEQKQEAESRRNRQINETKRANEQAQTSAQTSRDQRANKVKSDAAARLQAVKDAGFNLPQSTIDGLEKAAEEKARQVKAGTDTPMTAQEDADFHARQMQNDIDRQQNEIDRLKRDRR